MSHNAYELRVLKVNETAEQELLALRGERFFTIDDVEKAEQRGKSGKWYLALAAFAVGVNDHGSLCSPLLSLICLI